MFLIVVPVDHQPVTVRVEHRNDDDDDLVRSGLSTRRIVGCGQRVQQLVQRLRPAHLRRVNAAADGHDDLLGGGDLPRLIGTRACADRRAAGCRADLSRFGCSAADDDRGDRAVSVGRRPEVDDLDPVRVRGDELEVFFDRVRRGEVTVGTDAEPEMRLGRRYAICLLLSSRIDGEDDQSEREKDSPGAHARIIADGRSAALPRPVRSRAYRDDGRRG